MSPLRVSICVAILTGILCLAEPASAQMYYGYSSTTVVQPLPAPNYVVYSPNFLAFRSAGYYGGNWGPYYYNPQALYPVIPGNAIWPNRLPTYVPPTPPLYYYGR